MDEVNISSGSSCFSVVSMIFHEVKMCLYSIDLYIFLQQCKILQNIRSLECFIIIFQ